MIYYIGDCIEGFDYSSLYKFVRFYKAFSDILDSSSPKSKLYLSTEENAKKFHFMQV